ncbi:hypothetical protein COO60DRAFT_909405 [Scenedesmus sp. NREL 46B-D3]|nr:hypothetical protein COO60DRAFT_909405 [Scenedesmus sp. NREL 46B-D3]
MMRKATFIFALVAVLAVVPLAPCCGNCGRQLTSTLPLLLFAVHLLRNTPRTWIEPAPPPHHHSTAAPTVSSAQARSLQQTRPAFDISKLDLSKLPNLPALGLLPQGVELPPLQDFLPPLDSINLPP